MKRIPPAVPLGIASALLVVAFVVWDSGRISPGALSAVHARSAGIDEQDCEVCHGDGDTPMSAACGACHAEVAQQIEARTGFHGTMAADPAKCGACHGEHHGADVQLSGPRAFALAGVPDRDAYEHENLGFALSGAHVDLACKRCHEHADDVLLAKGCPRFGGEEQRCAACHEDPHAGKLQDCAACHGQEEPFAKVARFVHPASFALTGAHAKPGCLACHPKGSEWAVEASGIAGGQAATLREARTCEQCHASPHETSFLARVAASVASKSGAECAACHPTAGPSFTGADASMSAEMHALTGFALEPPHAEATCAQCHTPGALLPPPPPGSDAIAAFHALHPGRSAEDCKACHVDPHGGQFELGFFAGENCLACHAALAFTPPAFDVVAHAATAFPLTGSHEAVACGSCHAKAHADEPRLFHGTPSECAACHADAHRGSFDAVAGEPGAGGCERCHTTASFDALAQPFDHARWTGFALAGKHAQAECASCHPSSAAPDATGRTFGRVSAVFRGPPQACSTCHADVHGGAFARAPQPAVPAADSCARCHTEQGFDRARDGFDHASWTAFVLTGAHARTSCESCHVPRERPDEHGRRFGLVAESFPGNVADCRTCHVDPHGSRFDRAGMPAEIGGQRGCLRCHTTESFEAAATSFDHARWTGFALEGAHARVDCASCHAPRPGAEDAGFAPARGTSCQACHEDPHVGQFAKSGATDCARCHTVDTTFERVRFDHQRDSRFPLDKTHAKLECSSCHLPTPVGDGRTAVRYKPLGTDCGDCHDVRGSEHRSRRGRDGGREDEDDSHRGKKDSRDDRDDRRRGKDDSDRDRDDPAAGVR
jgi:hypothetical protein